MNAVEIISVQQSDLRRGVLKSPAVSGSREKFEIELPSECADFTLEFWVAAVDESENYGSEGTCRSNATQSVKSTKL